MGRSSSGKLSSSICSWPWSSTDLEISAAARSRLGGLPAGCLLLSGRFLRALASFLRLLDRRAKRLHEVHDLGGLRRGRRLDDLAVDLGLNHAHHRLAVLVLVPLGV